MVKRKYSFRDKHHKIIAEADLIFDYQKNNFILEVTALDSGKHDHFVVDNINDLNRYINLAVIDLGLKGYAHLVEEDMPV